MLRTASGSWNSFVLGVAMAALVVLTLIAG